MTCLTHHPCRRAFSLLETTIGIAILGIGLIMVAAFFPVALTQHRSSIDQVRALELVPQASAAIHKRLRADWLWYDVNQLVNGYDSPFHVLPLVNLDVGGLWSFDISNPNNSALPVGRDYMLNHTDLLNSAPEFSIHQIPAADFLSDRDVPRNDLRANEAANRMVWIGFYRQLANGSKSYAAAICKQRRNQQYFIQAIDPSLPENQRYVDPQAIVSHPQRLPVPWRVTVARVPGSQILAMNSTQGHLADSAPRGSKSMIHGRYYTTVTQDYTFKPGRILTVTNTVIAGPNSIGVEILEPMWDIPDFSAGNFGFDVWVIPPASNGALYDDGIGSTGADWLSFEKETPVLEWKGAL